MGIDHWLVERPNSTPAKFKRMCELIKPYVDPQLNRLYAEAWNEFPEDSVLEPTVENAFGYIDALRDAYCDRPKDGWPPNLYPTKNGIKEFLVSQRKQVFTLRNTSAWHHFTGFSETVIQA
jgi:hypothetical protein